MERYLQEQMGKYRPLADKPVAAHLTHLTDLLEYSPPTHGFGCIGDFAAESSPAARASGTFSSHRLVHRPYQVCPRNQYHPPGGVEAGCLATAAVQTQLLEPELAV